MKYCGQCGGPTSLTIPPGDTMLRHVCQHCQTIHYRNPKIVAGCIPEWKGQILLCKRAIEPRYGKWTFPAGFMENQETIEQAAIRETLEEAQATITLSHLYTVFSIPHVSQVYMTFRGTMNEPAYGVGAESLEVKLFDLAEIPWEDMAFRVIHETLALYCQDRETGNFPVHVGTIHPSKKM